MEINGVKFTTGADPEILIKELATGKFASAHGLIKGDKHKPFPVDGGAVQVDGLALEFNIDPCSSFEEFDSRLVGVMDQLKSMVPEFDFIEESSVSFDEDFLNSLDPDSLVLGCESDYNAYTMQSNDKPDAKSLMRTAGGHVHIGGFFTDHVFDVYHFESCGRLSRLLDETLGLPSLLWDKDDNRRSMYGKSGCFRPKTYGMEYRTLSNKWIFNKSIRRFVYDGVEKALTLMFDSSYKPDPRIRDVIDNSDRNSPVFKENKHVIEAQKQLGFVL